MQATLTVLAWMYASVKLFGLRYADPELAQRAWYLSDIACTCVAMTIHSTCAARLVRRAAARIQQPRDHSYAAAGFPLRTGRLR